MSETLFLDGGKLTVPDAAAVARRHAPVALTNAAWDAVGRGWTFLRALEAERRPVYGLTSGFGALSGFVVPREQNRAQQVALLKSHAAGMGPAMAEDAVRAMLAIRVNVLSKGRHGVTPEVLSALVAMLNARVTPRVPLRGSVGAGDLAPLAHAALPLIGHGRARIGDGPWQSGAAALAEVGIPQPGLSGLDGIALISGTEQATGIGALAVHDAAWLAIRAEETAALAMEALGASNDAFDANLPAWKAHPGFAASAERLRELTSGSISVTPPNAQHLRDPVSLRCAPQVLGAFRAAVDHARVVIETEINSANGNPLVDPATGFVTSNSGNFHGQHVAEALDALATSLITVAAMSERRSARMVDGALSRGLPPFLLHPEATPGVDHGMMIPQYTAAAIVAEMRMAALPASIQTIPTCANSEDHASMAPLAARRCAELVERAWDVLACEALLAAQALDLRGVRPAPGLAGVYGTLRMHVPTAINDRELGDDLEAVRAALTGHGGPLRA